MRRRSKSRTPLYTRIQRIGKVELLGWLLALLAIGILTLLVWVYSW